MHIKLNVINNCNNLLDLPLDIVTNILSRLPPESLFCLRCVSKALLNIVDDPRFVTQHAHSQVHVPHFMRLSTGHHRKPAGIEVLASLQSVECVYDGSKASFKQGKYEICVTARSIYNSENSDYKIDFVFCNLFFMRRTWGVGRFLINPLRGGEVLRLPMSGITRYGKYFNVEHDWYGMGFDQLTNSHKIVRVSRVYNGSFTENCLVTQILVLGTSSWREIPSVPPCDLKAADNVCAHGDMHWLVKGSEGSHHIVSFDFKKEEFYCTPHPALQSSDLQMLSLRGSLALVNKSSPQKGTMKIDIWVLKDYDRKEWSQEYDFESIHCYGSCGEWEHGIFFSSGDYTSFLDLNSFSLNHVEIQWNILSYTKSLVSLKQYVNLVSTDASDYGSLENYGKLIDREDQGFRLSEKHVIRGIFSESFSPSSSMRQQVDHHTLNQDVL